MRNLLGRYVNRYEKKHRDFRHYAMIVAVLALVVFVGVNWRLHDKGISMTSDYQCGLKEHKHTADCYKKVLICGKEETDGGEGHTHTDACYKEEKKLTCDKEEHKHNADCYDEKGNLICDKEEHTHSEDCYTTEKKLICGKEESKPVKAHHHTDACYKKELVCKLKEHTHTAACYSNENADVEDKSDWEATIPTLSGNWAEDIVSVAESQIGYEESIANFKLADDGETRKGYTRYGDWYGNKYGDWSAMFASFCLNYAGISSKTVPVNSGSTAWITELKQKDLYKTADNYNPTTGDLVFLDTDSDGKADHVGIITGTETKDDVEDSKVTSLTAIVGDSNDAVEENTYEISGDTIVGYCALPENPDEKKDAEATTAEKAEEEKTTEESTKTAKSGTDAESTTAKKAESKSEAATSAESATEDKKVTSKESEEAALIPNAEADTTAKTTRTRKALRKSSRSVAVQAVTNGIDFGQYITSVTMKHRANEWSSWSDISNNDIIDKNDTIQVNLQYTIPGKVLSTENNTITYTLPDALKDFTDSGKVFDSSGAEVGSYQIENGVVSISFNEKFASANAAGSPIKGYLNFSSKADKINTGDNNKINIKFDDENEINFEIKRPEEEKGDINVTKSTSNINETDGTVRYTITVSSPHGTNSEVTLNDIMTNIALNGDIQIVKEGQTITDGVTITKNSDNKGFSATLPKMNAGETYTITYTGKLPNDLKGYNITAKNKIEAKSTNTDNREISSEAEVETKFKPFITKTGKDKGNGVIEWTITVNKDKLDIGGWTLSDEIDGVDLSDREVQISPAINDSTTIKLPYTFPEGSWETYTITYTTEHTHDGWKNITNKADLSKDGNSSGSDSAGVNIEGKKNVYSKQGTGIELNEDGETITLNWNVNFTIAKDTATGWIFTDTPQNGQYFTPAQIANLKKELDKVFGADKYTLTNDQNKSETENWISIKVTGNEALKAGTNISFNYQTTAAKPETNTTFNNSGFFNNQWFGGNNTYKPDDYIVVRKVDANNESGGSNTSHDYNDGNIKGLLQWKILVNFNDEVRKSNKIIVTEHLPNGVSLSSLSCADQQIFIWNGDKGTATIWFNDRHIQITATKKSNNEIEIEIPKEAYEGNNTSQIAFKIAVTLDNADSIDWTQAKVYKNTVTVTNENNKELGTGEQTQTITNNRKEDLVEKGSKSVDGTNIIEYSVAVNKDGKDLLQDGEGGTLTIKDELKYEHNPNDSKAKITLVPDSVKIYKRNVDGMKGDLLASSSYSYTYTETGIRGDWGVGDDYYEKRINTLTVTIPDNTALILEYRYKVDGVVGKWVNSSNKATLIGNGNSLDDGNKDHGIQIKESSAGADIIGINVYKVDSNNYGTYLAGAKFSLYKWDENEKDYIIDKNYKELVSDDMGKIDLGELTHNQAYKLVEISPPDGYAMTEGVKDGYYFYIVDSNTNKYPVCKPDNFSGTLLSGGQTVYYPNTKRQDYTLPETGGSGTLPFITVGASLMGFALLCGYSMRRRRGRRVE